jgi:hypothetical protein
MRFSHYIWMLFEKYFVELVVVAVVILIVVRLLW